MRADRKERRWGGGRRPGTSVVLVVLGVLALTALTGCSSDDPLKRLQAAGEAPALPRLSVQQADVTDRYTVTLFPSGTDTVGVPTLDLCAATYPSERLRIGRRQVAVVDGDQRLVLSTEAVAYRDPNATAQAFTELRKARSECPQEFRTSDSGDMVLTTFGPDPDASWPPPPHGVERVTYDVVMVYEDGQAAHTVASYLRRGRMLLGVYFFLQPNVAVPSVEGRTKLDEIVAVFANRLRQLPTSVVNE